MELHPKFWEFTLRLSVAFVLGAIIGLDRTYRAKDAGFRTHILVSVGSALMMIISQYGFEDFISSEATRYDPARIAAQVVSGIGFIGAGTIILQKHIVRGLTTAAGLWTVGFIGLLIGAGFYTVALIGFIAMMICLSMFPAMERYFKNKSNHFEVHLELKNKENLQSFVATIRKLGLRIDDIEVNPAYIHSGLSVYSVSLTIQSDELKKYKSHHEIIDALRSIEYIHHIEEMS